MSDGQTPEELEADIERQREQLATTVDQLTAKLDVKSHAQAKVADVKSQAKVKVVEVKEAATTDDGKPRPEVLALAGALVGAAVLLIWWRRR
jgi:hypothetical protein